MPLPAVLLVMIAAVCHATWNFIIKKVEDRQLITWWAIMVGVCGALPFIWSQIAQPAAVWPYLLTSALAETIYYLVLIYAYEQADFSLIYPLARGTAPVLMVVWSIAFLHESPEPAGLAGVVIILFGIVIVGRGQGSRSRHSINAKGLWLALFVAVMISIYSVIDAAAVRKMAPLPYLMLVFALSGFLLAPFVLKQYGWRAMVTKGRNRPLQIGAVAVLMPLAYVLVLKAYAVAPVSYVGAMREVSIVFAALAGWRWLGEDFGKRRTLGALLIVAGILIISLAG